MTEKLLRCPFCGCKAILCSTGNQFATEKFFVSCGVCGVETPRIARTRKEAIAAWNRRAGKDTNVATNNAVPVVRGEWVLLGENEHDYETSLEEKCSLCGRYVYRYDTQPQDNYCPNCGAKMRETEANT